MRRLQVQIGDRLVGTLARTDNGEIFFEYDPDWLRSGFSISPYFLPLSAGVKQASTDPFDGLHGVFDDSLPDGWGRLLTDRFFRSRGLAPEALNPLDRLAYVGRHAMGALEYHPPEDKAESDSLPVDLALVAEQAERIVAGSPEETLPALRIAGGSSSGSRPKVFVAFNPRDNLMTSDVLKADPGLEHWLVKFRSRNDPPDAGAIEEAYATMARAAGVIIPTTRLFSTAAGDFFGTQRFDWAQGGQRTHTHSFGGLIHSSFRHPNRDYRELLAVAFDLTKDFRQVEQAYRRAAFNVFAYNRDDHVKNCAFLYLPGSGWRLSPAYDLTFSRGVGGQHNMTVAGASQPSSQNLLALANDAGIDRPAAQRILEEVKQAISRWPNIATDCGVSKASLSSIERAISPIR